MDAEAAFIAAMAEAGIQTHEKIVADGQLHRIHVEGHRRGTRNGAYVLHGDGRAAGWFQDFVTGTRATWKADGDWRPDPSAKQRMEHAKAHARPRNTPNTWRQQAVPHGYGSRPPIARGIRFWTGSA